MTDQPNFADSFASKGHPRLWGERAATSQAAGRNGILHRYGFVRTSIAGKVRVFTISFTAILVLLGVILGGAQAALTARSDQAGASASRAMAAAQLATSIAESRYFASRFAASGDAEVIRSAFTTLEQAHAEVEATIALKGGDAASHEQMEWLVTQVEVDPSDPAFAQPTKPIGYFFTEEEAKSLEAEFGWTMVEDAGRGWRQVVPSPEPRHICDISLVDALASRGTIVIAGGGGGIPVVRDAAGIRRGIEAVIDKDLTSQHMANVLGIEHMMILTSVSQVALHFGTDREQRLGTVSVSQMKRYQGEGHFAAGSMGPKVEAAIRFIERGGRRAIIAHLEESLPALMGEVGTHIVADD